MSSSGNSSTFSSLTIKKEPLQSNGVDNVVRLSSFSLPRDLTLGGGGPLRGRGGPHKKVYAPNLNVVRNKNSNVKTPKDTVSTKGRNRSDRGKSNRGGRGGKAALIQSTGIFSEGAGSDLVKRASSSYRSSWSERDEPSGGMQKPTLLKNDGKIDTATEEQYVKDILGDRIEEDFDGKKTDFLDLENVPVKLSEAKWKAHNKIKTEKVEVDEVKIKQEITDEGNLDEKVRSIRLQPDDPENFRYPFSAEDFFNRTHPQMFLVQLPDSLPCPDDEVVKDVSSTSKGSDQPNQSETQLMKSTLRSLGEGQIGKLVRYKSGRQQLILGNTKFDLALGMEAGFLQEVMSISTNREERSGNMANLGAINAKFTAIPDWESLFKDNS